MQRRREFLASGRRWIGLVAAALALSAGGFGLAPTVVAQGGRGLTLYGQVVEVSPSALVLALLNNGEWVAVNLTAQTVVTSQSAGPASVALNDWALVTYSVSRRNDHGQISTWLVARTVTYSTSPISTGGQMVHVTGRVSALVPGGFAITAAGGAVWSVTVAPATIVLLGETAATLAFLQVGDVVQVWGPAVGHEIVASRIAYRVASGPSNGKDRHRKEHD